MKKQAFITPEVIHVTTVIEESFLTSGTETIQPSILEDFVDDGDSNVIW